MGQRMIGSEQRLEVADSLPVVVVWLPDALAHYLYYAAQIIERLLPRC